MDQFFDSANLLAFFSQYAYEPLYVYSFIILFMTASSFGMPIPEELTLISAGLVAYLAHNPDKFAPPYEGAEPVNVHTLAVVAFGAVLFSDFIIYSLGRLFGEKLMKTKYFERKIKGKTFDTVQNWFDKYGNYVCGFFRFTPGLRFPGHLSCGFLKISPLTFLTYDGLAAMISVPTQIYLVATYGEVIIEKFREFKIILGGIFLLGLVFYFGRRFYLKRQEKNSPV